MFAIGVLSAAEASFIFSFGLGKSKRSEPGERERIFHFSWVFFPSFSPPLKKPLRRREPDSGRPQLTLTHGNNISIGNQMISSAIWDK